MILFGATMVGTAERARSTGGRSSNSSCCSSMPGSPAQLARWALSMTLQPGAGLDANQKTRCDGGVDAAGVGDGDVVGVGDGDGDDEDGEGDDVLGRLVAEVIGESMALDVDADMLAGTGAEMSRKRRRGPTSGAAAAGHDDDDVFEPGHGDVVAAAAVAIAELRATNARLRSEKAGAVQRALDEAARRWRSEHRRLLRRQRRRVTREVTQRVMREVAQAQMMSHTQPPGNLQAHVQTQAAMQGSAGDDDDPFLFYIATPSPEAVAQADPVDWYTVS